MLLETKAFVREFPNDKRPGLLLIGDSRGTGKTHLAVAALRMLMARGFSGLFCDYQTLLDTIRGGFDPAAARPAQTGLSDGARCRNPTASDDLARSASPIERSIR